MAKAISIGVAADTRQFSQAVSRGIVGSLDDVSDALDDVAADSAKAGDKLADSMKDAGKAADSLGRDAGKAGDKIADGQKQAQRSLDRTGDDAKSLSDIIERESRLAGRKLGDNIKRGADEGEDALREMGNESQSTAKEFAASFDGSIESVGDAFQELAANAFVGFGPAGAIAGIAAAVGLGALFTAISAGAEASEQRIQDMYADFVASGQDYLSNEYLSQAIQDIQQNTAQYAEAQQDAADTGVSLSTVLLAMAGDVEALNAVEAARSERLADLQKQQQEHIATTTTESDTLATQINTLETMGLRYDGVASSTETASAKARVYKEAMDGVGGASEGASSKVQGLMDKLNALPTNKTFRLDVDDSALEAALTRQQGRTIQVNIDGVITRIGNQVY